MSQTKGILLYSGGLDSLIAAKLLINQGIDIKGLHCILPYFPPDQDPNSLRSSQLASQIGLKLVHYRCGDDYISMMRNPLHGYGKEINPCIDCKIFFLNRASELMNELGADFVATGEVVGQRPMSQLKHTLNHIEKETGLTGRLLRPLSAKILKPTIVEIEGKVDRNRLLDISGRGRKKQLALAEEYGIKDFELPAGGCLFTDKNIASRIRDAFLSETSISQLDLYLMKIGRHFRINKNLKIIVSRNELESIELEKYRIYSDYFFYPDFSGPSVFVRGHISEEDMKIIQGVISRYSKASNSINKFFVYHDNIKILEIELSEPITDKELDLLRI